MLYKNKVFVKFESNLPQLIQINEILIHKHNKMNADCLSSQAFTITGGRIVMIHKTSKLLILYSLLSICWIQPLFAFSFPAYTSTETAEQPLSAPWSLGGSVIVFDTVPVDKNNLSPVMFSFHRNTDNPNTGKLCISGKVHATIYEGKEKGQATYELLSSDNSNTGICYSNVTRSCAAITNADVGAGLAEKCNYTSPAINQVPNLNDSLDGRFKIDSTLPADGPYADCATNPTKNICNFEVGFGFNDPIPANFFPASTTRNDEPVGANVPLYSSEVCIEFAPSALNLEADSDAIKSKFINKFRVCEAIAIKTNWCSDLQNHNTDGTSNGPSCETKNAEGQLTTGGMNTVIGSTLGVYDTQKTCVKSTAELKTLPDCPTAVAALACGDGTGYITFPDSFSKTACGVDGSDTNIFSYSSAQGGGSNTVTLKAVGAFYDAPGYVGDNTLPAIRPLWTAIVSNPDNQPNEWDFSSTTLNQVAYIHSRNNDDVVIGSKQDDTILGGSGSDTLHGNDGNDFLQGGDGVDFLFGDSGNDLLVGYECNGINASCISVLNKGSEDDVLNGGNGDDCLDGGRGADTLTGDAGNDAFVLYGTSGNNTITDFTLGEDSIVDMTGSAQVSWVKGFKGAPGTCVITTGGNNSSLVDNVSKTTCESITVVNVAAGAPLPLQCSRHPYAL